MLWLNISPHISKGARFTIGLRIENKFLDLLELAYVAYFSEKDQRMARVTKCILILDTLKFFVSVAWEGKLISNNQCQELAVKLEEIGRMFGGWKKKLESSENKNRVI